MSERLTRTTLPSPTLPPLLLVLSRPLLGLSSPLPPPLLLLSQSLVGASECAPMHRCIASTPLHYDSYIAIFIISAAHWCPRSHLTSVVSSPLVLFPFSCVFSLSRGEPLSFFGKSLPVNSRPLGGVILERSGTARWRTHSRRFLRVPIPS